MILPDFRPVSHSRTTLTELMIPSYANFGGKIHGGILLSLMASVNYVGRTSLLVGIKVIAENIRTASIKHTNTSYFTMVAKDEKGKPTPVPGLELQTKEEVRRFLEAIRRKEIKAQSADLFHNIKSRLAVDQELHKLEGERCRLSHYGQGL